MRYFFLISLGLFVSLSSQAKVTQATLENGLQILIKEDHRAPVVVHQVWYRVGSTYEHNGNTGLSHVLEHMMFKGTKTLAPGEFSKKVSRLGGDENAFTSSNYTAYYQVVGKQHLEAVMSLEADRMRNLLLDEEEFQKERDVVTEERRQRTDDKPLSRFYEQFRAMAFVNSPKHHPIIGWMADIRSWELADLQDWYNKWYGPNNAALVVVGDVNPQEVIDLANKYYGIHKAIELPMVKPQKEIPQEGERRLTLKADVNSSSLVMGWQVPNLGTAKTQAEKKEAYALTVLSAILDGSDSSRLTKSLVRDTQQLISASASYQAADRLKGLFTLSAKPAEGVSIAEAEKLLFAELERLQTELVSQKELQQILAQDEAIYIFQQDSIESQARIMGALFSLGLPIETYQNWTENLRKVTPKEIQQVAKKYFKADQLTVGVLLPKKTPSNSEKTSS